MKCAEFESTLADYIDGTLGDAGRAALELHASSCAGCRQFMSEVTGAVAFLKRAEEIEPPATLITRIAFQAPLGRTREPFEKQGFLSRATSRWLQPLLQPRLVMGMAMTILSVTMLERCTGVKGGQHIQAADLSPIHVWGGVEDKAVRLKDRVVKYYENLRVVYEVETRLKDLEQQQEAAQDQPPARKASANQRKRDQK
jgi:anti-sigma factor RsiW